MEETSPVSLKKQKATQKIAIEKKTTKIEKAIKPKKQTKKAAPVEDDASESEEQENDDLQFLATEIDPEDEDGATGESTFNPGQDVGKVPEVSKEVQEATQAPNGEPGVIYIGRIPHGFYEHEMRQYLSQFGPILRLRLSRNKKTGASKHFAFVEFAEASTAEIVSKTMDNYLLFGHILKCKPIPKEQVHDDLFKGANKRFKAIPWNAMAGKKLEKPLTESAWEAKLVRERNNRAKKAAKLKAIGYEFAALELKDVPEPPAIEIEEKEAMGIEAAPKAAEDEQAAEEAKDAEIPVTEPVVEAEVVTEPKKATKPKATRSTKGKKAKA